MNLIKIKERYEKSIKIIEKDIAIYEVSSNGELRRAVSSLKAEAEQLHLLIDAIGKQIPMAAYYEYDDEFTCPACNYFEDGISNVVKMKFCPECGQKLDWE